MFNTFFINLDKDQDRRAHMEKQLTSLGFEYERVVAVDGRMLSQDEISELYDSNTSIKYNKKDLTRGEIGCALSHKKCHELALNSKNGYILIVEDDIELPKNFKQIVEFEIIRNSKKYKWDYLQFDYPETGFIFIYRWFKSTKLYMSIHFKNETVVRKIKYITFSLIKLFYVLPLALFETIRNKLFKVFKINKPVTFYRPLYFAGCYLITKEGARKLLSLEDKIVFAADRLHNQARIKSGLKLKANSPLCVEQKRKEFGSSILNIKGQELR